MEQGIKYFGVNTHFQNGRADKIIRDLQTMERKIIIHAKGQWPESIHPSLWTYILLIAVHVHKNVPNAAYASSHIEAFTRISVSPQSSHYHTFGFPSYMLTTEDEKRICPSRHMVFNQAYDNIFVRWTSSWHTLHPLSSVICICSYQIVLRLSQAAAGHM